MTETQYGRVEQGMGHYHYAVIKLYDQGNYEKMCVDTPEQAEAIAESALKLAALMRADQQPQAGEQENV